MTKQFDVAVIGGGIVGLATAYAIAQSAPEYSILVLEKEDRVMAHQSGRNSGVIHSGIYYAPGSLKARLCREGKRRMAAFCEREGVDYEICGKVIVASTEGERPQLRAVYERGQKNGIACELIGPERLRELEPHVRGVEAIHVPESGIADYTGVGLRLAALLEERGHRVKTGAEVRDLVRQSGHVTLETTAGAFHAETVVNCAGLYADRVAEISGEDPDMQILPFRGEYFELTPETRHYCRNLIYPTPNPAVPFLGVHFTRMTDGRVECGPSAILAFAREGYRFGEVDWKELADIVTFPGFARLSLRHWRKGILEIAQSLSKSVYLRALRRLIPEVEKGDLVAAPSGVRAQAVTPRGEMVDDFVILQDEHVINVCNAPSPAATASLSIGEHIAQRAIKQLA